MQLTVALSSIVAGTSVSNSQFLAIIWYYERLIHLLFQTFNEHHLRRSLKTLITYVQNDAEMKDDENFCEQVYRTKYCNLMQLTPMLLSQNFR